MLDYIEFFDISFEQYLKQIGSIANQEQLPNFELCNFTQIENGVNIQLFNKNSKMLYETNFHFIKD